MIIYWWLRGWLASGASGFMLFCSSDMTGPWFYIVRENMIMMLWWYMVVYVLWYTKDGEDILLWHYYADACGYFDEV